MFPKDFENFELRLKKLREESLEDFKTAEKYFSEEYEIFLREVFPRDILGVKQEIGGLFVMKYGESLHEKSQESAKDIFKQVTRYTIGKLPLSAERKSRLEENVLNMRHVNETQEKYFMKSEDISRDPFFSLVEDFSLDGEISKEEFMLLEESFSGKQNFMLALESLPQELKRMFLFHIELALSQNLGEKQEGFESEYASELAALKQKGLNISPVIAFASRFFYKTPGKYRRYEHPKRRLRRTMKLALLKILRIKLGNIEAENILKKFEQGESFEDYFMILYRLLEVIDENPNSEEIYSLLKLEDEVKSDVVSAEENKQKILQGDFLVTKIASLFAKTDAKSEQQEMGEGVLEKLLDESTDIVGEDIYFNRQDENAGIFAEAYKEKEDEEESEEDEMKNASPEVAYEILRRDFHRLEEEKTRFFAAGEYDDIDRVNESLLKISIRLEKLEKILYLDI